MMFDFCSELLAFFEEFLVLKVLWAAIVCAVLEVLDGIDVVFRGMSVQSFQLISRCK